MKEYCAGQMMKVDWPNCNPEDHSEQCLVNQEVQYLHSSPFQCTWDQLDQSRPLCVVGTNEGRVTVAYSLSRGRVLPKSSHFSLSQLCYKDTFDISTFTSKYNHIKLSYSMLCSGQRVLLPTTWKLDLTVCMALGSGQSHAAKH
jgi:hypothetical protein